MVRFGILGTARIARAFFGTRLTGAAFVAVASRHPARGRRFAEEFGIPHVHAGYDALLEDPRVDAVYIPLPQHLHREYVLRAARRGKHVLVEKPAGLTQEEVRSMLSACRRRGVLFMEALMYRFLSVHRRAREILDSGTVGELRYIDYNLSFGAAARGITGFRMNRVLGGGALYDLGIYAVDFLGFISERRPVLRAAFMRREGGGGIDLFTHAVYTLGSVVAAVSVGFDSDANSYTLAGTKGSIHNPVALSGRPEPQKLVIHLHEGNSRYEEGFDPEYPYRREVEYFASCIEEGREPRPGGRNSLKNARMLDELFRRARSFQEGGRPLRRREATA